MARLALKDVGRRGVSIEVDWSLYGPKLAQVALTFGADHLDAVPATSDAQLGPRRATVEDVERNIRAAGFEPHEYRPRMSTCRLGAVSYLNTKPLVHGLEAIGSVQFRFDVPAQCAALLHEGRVDLGLIPAIEYLRGDYRIVPGVAIGSDGGSRR